jgi:hypothetical protein
MGGTELPSKLQLTVGQVHRDNGISASNSGGANRRQAVSDDGPSVEGSAGGLETGNPLMGIRGTHVETT